MTTNELIKLVLEHDAKATPGPWKVGDELPEPGELVQVFAEVFTPDGEETDCEIALDLSDEDAILTAHYRTAAPLLARKLQRAMESLEKLDLDAMVTLSHEVQEIAATAIAEIEAME